MSSRPPRTLAISAPRSDRGQIEIWLRGLRRVGVGAVQIRAKARTDREVVDLAKKARSVLDDDTLLLVNGRPDIALVVGANGVHLPASGLPTKAARSMLGSSALVGRSTHSIDEVRAAADSGADYVTFGPVYATPDKEVYGPPQGLEALERAARVGLPVLALGGITTIERIRECAATGAWGVAGIRLFAEPHGAASCVTAVTEHYGQYDDN